MDSHLGTNLRNLFYHRVRNTGRNFLSRVLVLNDDLLLPKANKDAISLHFHISD
jgi:hypothetical protein